MYMIVLSKGCDGRKAEVCDVRLRAEDLSGVRLGS